MKIVGITLVRNEDLFVERAVRNARAFCDEMLLVDHGSSDGTGPILRRLTDELACSYHLIRNPRESHELLKPHVGSNTWIFGVDGDEIYDPEGLKKFRTKLIAGEFDAFWMVLGNVLHCDAIDRERGRASGFASPPSRSITKFFNFSAISRWDGDTPERLHGGQPEFRPGFEAGAKRNLQLEATWNDSDLRCLHTCFLPRSSTDNASKATVRQNIMEMRNPGWLGAIKNLMRRWSGSPVAESGWKREKYQRGERLEVSTEPFKI